MMVDNLVYDTITTPPPPRCSQGHIAAGWTDIRVNIGGQVFCLMCIDEKLPPLLDWLGIGRILPEEDDNE